MRISDWSSDVCSSDLAMNACSFLFVVRQELAHTARGRKIAKEHRRWLTCRKKAIAYVDSLATQGANASRVFRQLRRKLTEWSHDIQQIRPPSTDPLRECGDRKSGV